MNNKKRVLICGDSFAADVLSDKTSWTKLLTNEYDVTNVASPGIGEYKILQQLKSNISNDYDYIIISHTSPNRIHTMENPLYPKKSHPYHISDVLFNDVDDKRGDNSDADWLYDYFLKVFDVEYYKYVHTSCCRDIDELTNIQNVLHITHFEWDDFYQFGHDFRNFYPMWLQNKGQVNHYNDVGNGIIFDSISEWLVDSKNNYKPM
jgi:hypothetical protein